MSELFSHSLYSFGFADGPAEDLYGIFINRVRRERPPEFLEKVRGWVDFEIHIIPFNSFLIEENASSLDMHLANIHPIIQF